jgi:hypothetical protein
MLQPADLSHVLVLVMDSTILVPPTFSTPSQTWQASSPLGAKEKQQ